MNNHLGPTKVGDRKTFGGKVQPTNGGTKLFTGDVNGPHRAAIIKKGTREIKNIYMCVCTAKKRGCGRGILSVSYTTASKCRGTGVETALKCTLCNSPALSPLVRA